MLKIIVPQPHNTAYPRDKPVSQSGQLLLLENYFLGSTVTTTHSLGSWEEKAIGPRVPTRTQRQTEKEKLTGKKGSGSVLKSQRNS